MFGRGPGIQSRATLVVINLGFLIDDWFAPDICIESKVLIRIRVSVSCLVKESPNHIY